MCGSHLNLLTLILCAFVLNVLSAALTTEGPKKWPSRFPRCYRDDPNLNKCMLAATKTMKPFLKAGIPEFNIAPINPFVIPEVTIQLGSDPAGYKIVFRNLVINGFDSYEFDRFDFDVKNLEFKCSLRTGRIEMSSDYSAKGQLFTIPAEGNGKMHLVIANSSGHLDQKVKLVKKNGVTYIEPQKATVQIEAVDVIENHFDGLFSGNEVLAKAAKQVFDDNRNELMEELKPAVTKIIEEIILDMQRKILRRLPYDELYPLHL